MTILKLVSRKLAVLSFIFAGMQPLQAEPNPGDLFREYTYSNPTRDAGGALRVGGKKGVSHPDRGSDLNYVNAWVAFPSKLDLEHCSRAELVVEKILSHNGTHGLAIQWNQSPWLVVPEPAAIPEPRRDYYHHTCITIPLETEHLQPGNANKFRLRVDPDQDWNWPQHLIYGVHLRVYYDAKAKKHATGTINAPVANSAIGRKVPLKISIAPNDQRINRVDYVGAYEGINWEGDGRYDRWHFFFYHGQLTHHLGSGMVAPFHASWDTSWVPDQTKPVQIAARVVDDTGLTYMTPAISELKLERPGLSVELCKPQNVPDNWVTRNKSYEQSVVVRGALRNATAARLVWSSWSPGYMNGVFINGQKVLQSEGPKYRYYDHRVDLRDLDILQPGQNQIRTGKTPLYDGQMVHGMEVNWPGIQLLIQYETP